MAGQASGTLAARLGVTSAAVRAARRGMTVAQAEDWSRRVAALLDLTRSQ